MIALALALVSIRPAFVSGPVHAGERVRFVIPGPRPGDGVPELVAVVDDLRTCKHLEAFLAGREVRVPGDPPRLPTGEAFLGIEPGTEGVARAVSVSSPWNDEPEVQVRVADGPYRGRVVWVRLSRLEPLRPPPPETIRERRQRELRRTLELRRGRR